MDECTREDIPVLIAIEGLIAAGKSSLIDYYTGLNVNRLPEPVHIWQDFANSTILNMRYNNPKRYAFCFQILADLTRLDQLQDVRYSKQVTLMERSLLSGNRLFAKLDMGYAEGKILNYWHSFLEKTSCLTVSSLKQVSIFLILPVPYYHIKCQLFNYKIYRTSLIFFKVCS